MKQTLDNFRVDDSNREAYEQCLRVVKEVKNVSEIVHIHGTAGVGKTHLLQAMKRQMEEELYLTVELIEGAQLVEMFIAIFKASSTCEYPIQEMYPLFADVDVLLIDNIHCLIGRSATQELVGELLCDMVDSGKTVVFTTEKSLAEMGLESLIKYLEDHNHKYTDVHIFVPGYRIKEDFLNEYVQDKGMVIEEEDREYLLKYAVTFRELNAILNQIFFRGKVETEKTNTELLHKALQERGKYYKET